MSGPDLAGTPRGIISGLIAAEVTVHFRHLSQVEAPEKYLVRFLFFFIQQAASHGSSSRYACNNSDRLPQLELITKP